MTVLLVTSVLIDFLRGREEAVRFVGPLSAPPLSRPGHSGVGAADLVIAATVELTAATLVTLNVRHFPMFEGLRLYQP